MGKTARPGSLFGRLCYRLSHRAARDRARRDHDRRADAIARAAGPGQLELTALVSTTLFHQGGPLENARMVAELLDGGRSFGWDAASYEVDGERVEVSLLGEAMFVDRTELRALLRRIIDQLEALERELRERAR